MPVVKADRITHEMPFPDHGSLVTGRLEELGKGLLSSVEGAAVVVESIEVAVLAGHDDCPARSADGVGDDATAEEHPLFRDAVHVRRLEQFQLMPVGADRLDGEIVAEEEDDVRFCFFVRGDRQGREHGEEGESGKEKTETHGGDFRQSRQKQKESQATPAAAEPRTYPRNRSHSLTSPSVSRWQ